MDASNIVAVFLKAAAEHPGRPVLLQDGDSVSYAELETQVRQKAGELRRRGIGRGDAVLVFVPLSVDLYRTVLALFYLGATPVFLDEWVSLDRLKACVQLLPCKALVAPLKLRILAFFIPVLRRIGVKTGPGQAFGTGPSEPAGVEGKDTALVTFTTGSTGRPKAADRTNRFLHAQLEALRPLLDDGLQSSLTLLPIVVLLNMALGKTTVLPPRRFRAKKIAAYSRLAAAIGRHHPQTLILSPAMADRLLDAAPPDLLAVPRRVLTGGGPVFPQLARKLAEKMPAASVLAVFGSTEAEPIAHTDGAVVAAAEPKFVLRNGLPLGKVDVHARVLVLPWQEGAIVAGEDAVLERVSLRDQPGEIVVSGPHVLEHYLANPAAEALHKIRTAERVWHRTGDCGRLDAAGRLFLYGRCAEMFLHDGRAVYPVLVEYYLQTCAGLSAVALLPDGAGGTLVLEKGDAPRAAAVRELAAGLGLADARVVFVPAVPKDPRHQTKVDREKLRKLLARG